MIYAKFFTPWTRWTWFVTKGSQEEDSFIFFGYVIGIEAEWVTSHLTSSIQCEVRRRLTIEPDLYFNLKRKSEIPDIT